MFDAQKLEGEISWSLRKIRKIKGSIELIFYSIFKRYIHTIYIYIYIYIYIAWRLNQIYKNLFFSLTW